MTNQSDKQQVTVNGAQIAYLESGTGDPIVFLHGNPTSSYLWRRVIPEVSRQGRCLAPDLIGMGDSDKLPDSGPGTYTFAQHRDYLDGWLDAVHATTKLTLVGHDWGAALAFDWARRHPDAVRAIAYMEAPIAPARWADLPPQAAELFHALRSPAGDQMILEQNMFVEQILPSGQACSSPCQSKRWPSTAGHTSLLARTAAPRSPGRARSRSTATRPTSPKPCTSTPTGWQAHPSPSCSSTPTPAKSSPAPPASSAAPGPTKPKSPSPADTSSKKTQAPKSAKRSPASYLPRKNS